MNRKIIQLIETHNGSEFEIWALCDDGTVWAFEYGPDGVYEWEEVCTDVIRIKSKLPNKANPTMPRA